MVGSGSFQGVALAVDMGDGGRPSCGSGNAEATGVGEEVEHPALATVFADPLTCRSRVEEKATVAIGEGAHLETKSELPDLDLDVSFGLVRFGIWGHRCAICIEQLNGCSASLSVHTPDGDGFEIAELEQCAAHNIGFQILLALPDDTHDGTEFLNFQAYATFRETVKDAIHINVRIVMQGLSAVPRLAQSLFEIWGRSMSLHSRQVTTLVHWQPI